MQVKFTLRFKPGQNPPKFHPELPTGVLEERTVEFIDLKEDDPMFIIHLLDYAKAMKDKWIEVLIEKTPQGQ